MIRLSKLVYVILPLVLSACVHQARPSCESNLQPINVPAPVVSEPQRALPADPGEK